MVSTVDNVSRWVYNVSQSLWWLFVIFFDGCEAKVFSALQSIRFCDRFMSVPFRVLFTCTRTCWAWFALTILFFIFGENDNGDMEMIYKLANTFAVFCVDSMQFNYKCQSNRARLFFRSLFHRVTSFSNSSMIYRNWLLLGLLSRMNIHHTHVGNGAWSRGAVQKYYWKL